MLCKELQKYGDIIVTGVNELECKRSAIVFKMDEKYPEERPNKAKEIAFFLRPLRFMDIPVYLGNMKPGNEIVGFELKDNLIEVSFVTQEQKEAGHRITNPVYNDKEDTK